MFFFKEFEDLENVLSGKKNPWDHRDKKDEDEKKGEGEKEGVLKKSPWDPREKKALRVKSLELALDFYIKYGENVHHAAARDVTSYAQMFYDYINK